MNVEDAYSVVLDVSRDFSETYYEKMDMGSIALLNLFIIMVRDKFRELDEVDNED